MTDGNRIVICIAFRPFQGPEGDIKKGQTFNTTFERGLELEKKKNAKIAKITHSYKSNQMERL